MSAPGDYVRKYHATAERARRRLEQDRAERLKNAKRLRFAWIEGNHTLYKFKSLNDDSRDHVLDMVENSRLYFPRPAQFNDPFDCAPVFSFAKPLSDPEFLAELRAEEDRMIAQRGLTPAERLDLRNAAVDVGQLAQLITTQTRDVLRDDVRIFCLSARLDHPLLWSHYADSHKGVCLHFVARPGSVIGGARAVKYRTERVPVLVPFGYNRNSPDIADKMVR